MGYIYKITNKINNKMYIGQTITTIKERMYKHYSNAKKATTGIDFAIGKYGKENFIVEEVCSCLDEDLDDLEQFYIAKFDTYNTDLILMKNHNIDTSDSEFMSNKSIIFEA